MKKNIHIVLGLVCLLTMVLCASCKKGNLDMLGMFYTLAETADERFRQSREYSDAHGVDTISVAAEDYRIYVMTDIHTDYTTNNLDTFCRAFVEDPKAASFCFCLGDQINAVDHYPLFFAYIDSLRAQGREVYSTCGNHDIYYNQWKIYRDYWKTSTYILFVRTPSGALDFYIFLDSSSGTLGAEQLQWLRDMLAEHDGRQYRHRIVCTHTHFWKKDQSQGHTSNFAMEETYELADIFAENGIEYVLQGHSHHRNLTIFRGVNYLRLDAMEDHYYNAAYTVFDIGRDIDYRFIPVGPQDPSAISAVRVPDIPY